MPTPRKSPVQARSRAMVEAILDASARVLVRDGQAGFNTNRVAEVAGVSVGSLYQYFPNKAALVQALAERHVAQSQAALHAVIAQAQDLSLPELVPRLVAAFVAAHAQDPALHRALSELAHSGQSGGPASHDLLGAAPQVQSMIHTLLERHRESLLPTNLHLATVVVMTVTHALVHAVVIDAVPPASVQAMQDEISALVLRYLVAAPAGTRPLFSAAA